MRISVEKSLGFINTKLETNVDENLLNKTENFFIGKRKQRNEQSFNTSSKESVKNTLIFILLKETRKPTL